MTGHGIDTNGVFIMIGFLKKSSAWALSIIGVVFTFVPEAFFGAYKLLPKLSDETNILLSRIFAFLAVLVSSIIVNLIYLLCRRKVCLKGVNYGIQIEYGDIFNKRKCKKVIPFDECFTVTVGNSPSDINPGSICGQYLTKYQIQNIKPLIANARLDPAGSKSRYQNKDRYVSGKLVPNGDYLLMAFAKLDKAGLGVLTYDEFLDCLSVLWEEIDKYYQQKDVCIPVLGSGVTRFDSSFLTQQRLLDIIIESYRLSPHKIKSPCKLHIVCKRVDGFSLNDIEKTF